MSSHRRNHLRHMIFTALFAALIYVTTRYFQIPNGFGGYVHPGDCLCLLAAFLLPTPWAIVGCATGSFLADLLSGFAIYAPATAIIKGGVALIAALLLRHVKSSRRPWRLLIAGLVGESFMVVGYFLFNALVLSYGHAAWAAVPGDALQAVFAVIAATLLYFPLSRALLKLDLT